MLVRQGHYILLENERIARDIYRMRLHGDTSALTRPGQFVNVRVDGFFLRRPISVCSVTDTDITLIYKIAGRGTEKMARTQCGETLDLLTGLGNGFDADMARGRRIALVGGGCGLPPLYGLMERLRDEDVTCVMGFASAQDVFYAAEFAALGARVEVTTMDGTMGTRGTVCDVLAGLAYDYYYACGPLPMLRAVHRLGREGQLSFEERMGCGFGACMGCSCETLAGPKRICREGPVMHSGEVAL